MGGEQKLPTCLHLGQPVKPFYLRYSTFSNHEELPVSALCCGRRAVVAAVEIAQNMDPVLKFMEKYSDVPMSLADACLMRMTETLADCVVLTTDEDFRVYRRHSRRMVPCVNPQ